MTTVFNNAGLVHIDVSGVGSDNALPGQEDRVDNSGVCLGPTD